MTTSSAADRERRPSQRRAELLDAAIAAIREDGPNLSMEAMAARAGITKPILYRHFEDRAGLCAAIVERFASELEAELTDAFATAASDADRVRIGVDAYLRFIERDEQVYRFLTERAGPEVAAAKRAIDDFVRRVGRLVTDVLRTRFAQLGVEVDALDVWGQAVVGMVYAVGSWWLDHPEHARDGVRDAIVTLAWSGLSGTTTTA